MGNANSLRDQALVVERKSRSLAVEYQGRVEIRKEKPRQLEEGHQSEIKMQRAVGDPTFEWQGEAQNY